MIRFKFIVVVVFLQFSFLKLSAQEIDLAGLQSEIDKLVPERVSDSTPGLVVGVVKDGKLIFGKGYGLANLSYDIPNDTKMVYNIGSVSKQFLGYAFAMLHVDGKLNLDDPVSQYLENWPEFEHKVTLRHLLTHTSGYREAYTMSNLAGRYIGQDRLSRKECLDVVRRQPKLEFVPGSQYTYNSTAWVILAEVLDKVTGTPADEWVDTQIIKPLNMADTQIESFVGEVIKNAAESYSSGDQGYTNEESNRAIFGAAEVYTSVEDLVKWINNYKTAQVGGKEVLSVFLDPFILNDGRDSGYALGIGIGEYRGLRRYRHTGGHEAFVTQLSYYPDHDLGIIVISNSGGRNSISSSSIAELILGEQMTTEEKDEINGIDFPVEKLQALTGLYVQDTRNDTVELTLNDKGKLIGEGRFELIPVSENEFRIADWDGVFQIDLNTDSNAKLIVKNSSGVDTYFRSDKLEAEPDILKEYQGKYWSDELETYYTISLKDDNLKVNHRWIGEVDLNPLASDLFRGPWGTYFSFTRTETGEINGFNINSGRTLNVFFKRK